MQVHEITEGFWKNVGRGFAQGVTGINALEPSPADAATVKQAQATQQARATTSAPAAGTQSTADKKIPARGTIFLVNAGGMEYFKNHQGQWFEKPDFANRFSASRAFQIKDPVKTDRLDSMLPRASTVFVRPESSDNNIVFVPDPAAERRAEKAQQDKG